MGVTTITLGDGTTATLNTTNGLYAVPYFDYPQEYSEDWQTDSCELRRTVGCTWDQINNFLLDFLGWAVDTGGTLNRFLPEEHPAAPSFFCVSCKMIELDGKAIVDGSLGFFNVYNITSPAQIDPATKLLANPSAPPPYGYVKWQVIYKKPSYPVLADSAVSNELQRFVEKRYSFGIEHLPLSGTGLKYADTGDIIGVEKFPLRLPTKALLYTWYGIPADPTTGLLPSGLENAIEAVVGLVNDAVFDPVYASDGVTLIRGYAAGTLLCDAPETVQVQLANGDFAYNITYKFLFRSYFWNSKYRGPITTPFVSPAGFYPVVNKDSSGDAPYLFGDFMTLFQLGT